MNDTQLDPKDLTKISDTAVKFTPQPVQPADVIIEISPLKQLVADIQAESAEWETAVLRRRKYITDRLNIAQGNVNVLIGLGIKDPVVTPVIP